MSTVVDFLLVRLCILIMRNVFTNTNLLAPTSLPDGKDAKNESPSKTSFVPFHAHSSTYSYFDYFISHHTHRVISVV